MNGRRFVEPGSRLRCSTPRPAPGYVKRPFDLLSYPACVREKYDPTETGDSIMSERSLIAKTINSDVFDAVYLNDLFGHLINQHRQERFR